MLKSSLPESGQAPEERGPPRAYGQRGFDAVPDRIGARALLRELAGQVRHAAPVAPDAPLVIYGAGNFGRMALDVLRDVGVVPAMVVDANAERIRNDGAWAGIELCAPHEVPDTLKASALIAVSVVTSPVVPILESLRAQGWRRAVPFYDVAESFRPAHPLSNGWFADLPSGTDLAQIGECLDRWDDDLSRAHHLMFLAWRLARQEWCFDGAEVDNASRFFIPEILDALRSDDLFVDGGAHHGGVSQSFLAATGPAVRIVAFEPDPANADRYDAWRLTLPPAVRERIELRRVALDARPRRRNFHDGLGYMAQLTEDGPARIETRTLDGAGLAPGFVKLHLEGGELDALRGGLQTLLRSRPLLAATVYHNDDGLWRTARWLADNLADYRLIMRTHSWCGTGAVIYAIPEERMPRP